MVWVFFFTFLAGLESLRIGYCVLGWREVRRYSFREVEVDIFLVLEF